MKACSWIRERILFATIGNMKRVTVALLVVLILFAFGLRTYKITSIPPSLTWDEVSIGYNAYSILKTGKDEHGKILPLDAFVGYGDYKPPLSIYITVPFVAIFGLNELSVRLPSALFGTATVLLMFFLVREMLWFTQLPQDKKKFAKTNTTVALFSVLVSALSPWHINISRAGFEANIALFFVCLGIYSIVRSVRTPSWWVWAFLPFVGAIYTFNSARYTVVFLGLGLIIWLRQAIRIHIRNFLIGVTVACIFLIPIVPHLTSQDAWLRFREVNIFSDASIVQTSNERIAQSGNAWWSKIIYNRRIGYARSFVMHFLDHFEPRYLFIRGDGNPKFSIQDVGQLYIADIPFVVLGTVLIFSVAPALGWFLVFWMVVAILPAATARETPHALRTLQSLPVWVIIISFGVVSLINTIKSWSLTFATRSNGKIFLYAISAFCLMLYAFNVLYYLHNYYRHYPLEYANEWQYGYKQAIGYALEKSNSYNRVFITDSIGRPYMYTLFYLQYDPQTYLNEKESYFDAAGFYHVTAFGKYRFPVGAIKHTDETKNLYIVHPNDLPLGVIPVYTIDAPDGKPVLELYET